MSTLADNSALDRSGRVGRVRRARVAAARHPHLALLGVVCGALATEPAVQAGRDAASTLEYAGAAVGLVGRVTIALVGVFIAWEGKRRLRLAPVLGCALLLGAGWLALHLLLGVEPDQDLTLQVAAVAALVVLAARVRSRARAVALAALAPAAFLLTNRVSSSQFLVLLVAVWALLAALVVASDREQLAVGLAIAGATFANALVHPDTVPVAWQLASAVMFALAIGLTAWLVLGATRPRASTEVPP